MDKKILLVVIAVVLLIAGGVGYYFLANREKSETSNNPEIYVASEQVDAAKFNEYFKSIYLGKISIGKEVGGSVIPQVTLVFQQGKDQYCTVLEAKKAISAGTYASAIYNLDTKTYVKEKTTFSGSFNAGANTGCGDLPAAVGKYEYKAYLNNILIAVVPFEIVSGSVPNTETNTGIDTSTSTNKNNSADTGNNSSQQGKTPILEFSAGGCDSSLDPYTEPFEGITGKSWSSGILSVSAYVKTLCEGINIQGTYALNGNNLSLKIDMTHSGPQGECYCARKLTYKFSNLEQKEYQILIIRGE